MTKINVDSSLFFHPKIQRLRARCGLLAEIYIIRLWSYCADFHYKDGVFKGYTVQDIEGVAGWSGPDGNLVYALENVGLLDARLIPINDELFEKEYKIHDWTKHAGFIKIYKESGRKGGIRSGKSRRIESKATFNPTFRKGSTIELNGIEYKDSLTNPPESLKEPKKTTDLQKVVLAFKIVSGYDKNDTSWDQAHFARCAKSAKALLGFLGEWRVASDCIQDVYERLTGKGLTVTLETILKHSADWKKDRLEKGELNGRVHLQSHGSGPING